jgi:hypothetical protein
MDLPVTAWQILQVDVVAVQPVACSNLTADLIGPVITPKINSSQDNRRLT